MIVEPSLTTHPKFQMFKRALGDPQALEYLLRLWGHCQLMRRGENWGKMNADYIEAVCAWSGEQGKLFKALSSEFCGKPGWIKVSAKGEVIIVGWEEHNRHLVTLWDNASYGKRGGRPAKKPIGNPMGYEKKPIGSEKITHRPPRLDRIGEDRSECTEHPPVRPSDGEIPEGETAGKPSAHFAEIPSLAEVLAFANGPAAIPEKSARKFFEHYEKTAAPPWTDANGRRFQWQGKLASWATRDREVLAHGHQPEGTPTDKTLEQLEAELAAETDSAKRQAIRAEIKKARGGTQ